MVKPSADDVYSHVDMGEVLVENAAALVEGSHMEPEHPSGDVGRAASLVVVLPVGHTGPCAVNGVELEDMYRNQKNCCECSHPGHGIVDREASCNHTLADQVGAGSSQSSRRRRLWIQADDGAICV